MPFNFDGNWVPEPLALKPSQPIKIVKERRKNTCVTLIYHLDTQQQDLKKICTMLKQRYGCGGSVKENVIELQGDQMENVMQELTKLGIKLAKKK